MSIARLLANVEDITKRPDARDRALTGLNAVIYLITSNADYPEDLVEVTLANPTPQSLSLVIPIELPDGSPSLRKIEYVSWNDNVLKNIKPRNVMRAPGCPIMNCYYRSGNSLVLNVSRTANHVRLGYYQAAPWITEESTHWLIEQQESLLVPGVAAEVFKSTGDDASYAIYWDTFNRLLSEFRRSRNDTEEL